MKYENNTILLISANNSHYSYNKSIYDADKYRVHNSRSVQNRIHLFEISMSFACEKINIKPFYTNEFLFPIYDVKTYKTRFILFVFL